MTILMMAGQDNDCTGGPIGHAYGVMLGLDALDDKLIDPFSMESSSLPCRIKSAFNIMRSICFHYLRLSLSQARVKAAGKHWGLLLPAWPLIPWQGPPL